MGVFPRLFVGSQSDYESNAWSDDSWSVVHACKDPYHREALGYAGRGAPKDHPEYLLARRGNRLILNLVDAADPAYIAPEIMDAAVAFIHEHLSANRNVLVHCNQGHSRGPGIAMLYLGTHTDLLPKSSFAEAVVAYRALYPEFEPAGGIRGYLERAWPLLPKVSERP